ncbi:hypothetical protein NDU88_004962 [Pleurodeles waltl]|uniref:Uncharacterized protein n=1 Tax=Pleurodeles waltl TaxID=8319 RepID=A0AAV7MWF0_PLEWA|nr:hypothetical protein NDU88_004962 [Pleurodeles waltl]
MIATNYSLETAVRLPRRNTAHKRSLDRACSKVRWLNGANSFVPFACSLLILRVKNLFPETAASPTKRCVALAKTQEAESFITVRSREDPTLARIH